jgi:hypothetical protein
MIVVRLYLEPLDDNALPASDRLTVLRGQLTFLRVGAEQGIPAAPDSIRRAEQLARTLELDEVPA